MNETEAHAGEILWRSDAYRLISCARCGFAHVLPLPSPEELKNFYRDTPDPASTPEGIARREAEAGYWRLVHQEAYALYERLIEGPSRRLLDIGCSGGLFMEEGERLGWETLGIEPVPRAADHARRKGLEIREGYIHEVELGSLGEFDLVRMSHVLEHVPHPAELLERIRGVLRPGGLVVVETPNDFNPLQKLVRKRLDRPPWWVVPPRHVNYFSFDSLTRLLERCGYRVVHRTAGFPMELFLLMGDDYVADESVGRECHRRRMALESALLEGGLAGLKSDLCTFLAEQGVGRNAIVVGRKPEEGLA